MLTLIARSFAFLLALAISLPAFAFETVKVSPRVYALVGDLGQRSPDNLGHNMTSGFIVGDEAVVVVDPGASRAGAQAIREAVRAVTDKPVRWVVNTGGQDHRWLGNDFFHSQGAQVVASAAAAADMHERGQEQIDTLRRFLGNRLEGTVPAYPDITFDQRYALPLTGIQVELIYTGGGHTIGDSFVWLPEERIVFSGDMVYVQRLLGVRQVGAERWLKSLEYLRDTLQPAVVIPGHGHVTDLAESLRDSYDYLQMLRESVQARIENGAFDPVEASQGLDQSRFSYLQNYDDIPFRAANARQVAEELFRGMETKQ